MIKFVTESPDGNFGRLLNYAHSKDMWCVIPAADDGSDISLTDYCKRLCSEHQCEFSPDTDDPNRLDEHFCDCMFDYPVCPIVQIYILGSQASCLRDRLRLYEDTDLSPEEILKLKNVVSKLGTVKCLNCGCTMDLMDRTGDKNADRQYVEVSALLDKARGTDCYFAIKSLVSGLVAEGKGHPAKNCQSI